MSLLSLPLMILAVIAAAGVAYRRPALFPIVLLMMGTLRFGAEVGEGLNLSAIWLLLLIILSVAAVFRLQVGRLPLSLPEKAYLVFLSWAALEAFRGPDLVFAARMMLKLAYPFLVMFLARRAMLGRQVPDVKASMRLVTLASFAAFILVGGFTQRFLPALCGIGGQFLWPAASFADHAAIMGVACLAFWRFFKSRWYLVYAALAAVSPVIVDIRTGIGAFFIGASVFVLLTFRRATAIPLLAGGYLLAGASLLLVPNVRDRMFHQGFQIDTTEAITNPGSVSWDSVNDSGRRMLWEKSLTNLFDPNPLLGSGVGSVQQFMYTQTFTGLKVVHSSYVEFLCDTGLVGLSLYIVVALVTMGVAWKTYRRAADPGVKALSLCAVCGLPALLFCMGFDNIINYALPAGQFPFVFAGIAAGLAEKEARRRRQPIPSACATRPLEAKRLVHLTRP